MISAICQILYNRLVNIPTAFLSQSVCLSVCRELDGPLLGEEDGTNYHNAYHHRI
jgi:hypothetical protein